MNNFIPRLFNPNPINNRLSDIENIALIFCNIFPIFGVLFFKWEAFPILLLYGVEAVIGMFFEVILQAKSNTSSIPKIAMISGYLFFISTFLILQVAMLTILFSLSNSQQVLESTWNIFFGFSLVLFVSNQIIFKLKHIKDSRMKVHNRPLLDKDYVFFFFKQALLVIMAVIIIETGSYVAALIGLILIKTFWDIRSYLRNNSQRILS